jgi:hypothetical protein
MTTLENEESRLINHNHDLLLLAEHTNVACVLSEPTFPRENTNKKNPLYMAIQEIQIYLPSNTNEVALSAERVVSSGSSNADDFDSGPSIKS